MYDLQETKRRGYSGKSKVYFDGRERLYGKDWQQRKRELWARAGGKCEQVVGLIAGKPPVRCWFDADDPHHVIKRSKGRDDRMNNLRALCRMHHELMDGRKPCWGQASQLRNKRLLGIA